MDTVTESNSRIKYLDTRCCIRNKKEDKTHWDTLSTGIIIWSTVSVCRFWMLTYIKRIHRYGNLMVNDPLLATRGTLNNRLAAIIWIITSAGIVYDDSLSTLVQMSHSSLGHSKTWCLFMMTLDVLLAMQFTTMSALGTGEMLSTLFTIKLP